MHNHRTPHASAGGGCGRSSAMSRKISWDICRAMAVGPSKSRPPMSHRKSDLGCAPKNLPKQLPFILCAAGINGAILALRFHGPGREPEILAEHYPGPVFGVPINIMVVDRSGDAARITITKGGNATWH